MSKRIVIIDGHPDPAAAHLGNALADSYADAAQRAGHEVRRVPVATLDFPMLRSQEQLEHGTLPASIARAQEAIAWANHIAIFYPLWNADMPALLKGFFEQTFREGFSISTTPARGFIRLLGLDIPGVKGLLAGKSARIIVTMRMPAFLYRVASLKSLERFLALSGISPIRATLLGGVAHANGKRRAQWFADMRRLGESAA
ncbi:MAG: NAD(P)H-dependent oxidoreductase [Vulcanimicrobiaceae bacterium]